MYPLDVFTLFPSFPREDTVFVAMSFGGQHDDWYNHVIKKAINEVSIDNDEKLVPFRVDYSQTAHSINAEIIKNISSCRLFFADLSTLGHTKRNGVQYTCRNNNVIYELGLATATRLSKEVVLFKSDNDPLPLDIYDLNVNTYDSDPDKAKEQIKLALESAIKEIELKKLWSVQRAVDVLSENSRRLLISSDAFNGTIPETSILFMRAIFDRSRNNTGDTQTNSIGEMTLVTQGIISQISINQLLDLGILTVQYSRTIDSEGKNYTINPAYTLTPFGKEVKKEVWNRLDK